MTTQTKNIIDLKENDQIKTEMDKYSPTITIHTVEAFYEEMNQSSTGVKYDINEMIRQTREKNQHLVWSMQHAAILTANYKGKAEAMQKKADAYKNAVLIKDGDTVRVNERLFKVKYTRPNVSDPVHFNEIDEQPEFVIASDKELFKALGYLYHYSSMPPNIVSKKVADTLNSINEQLEDLNITDDEGCFKNTVLGLRAQTFEENHYGDKLVCQICEKVEVQFEAEICEACAIDENTMMNAVEKHKAKKIIEARILQEKSQQEWQTMGEKITNSGLAPEVKDALLKTIINWRDAEVKVVLAGD